MTIKEFLLQWNCSPAGRLFRRFYIVGLAALIPYFISKVGLDPMTIVDKIITLPASEWLFFVKLFVGAGLVGGIDKLTREWKNLS